MFSDRNSAFALCSNLALSLILFFCWSELFQESCAELRFCLPHHGPQKMKDTDCPGGFVFNELVNTENDLCRYYAKTGDHKRKVLITPTDICSGDSERVIDNVGDNLNDTVMLSYFRWEEEDTNDTLGIFNPTNICEEECLPMWADPHVVNDEEPMPDDFVASQVTEEEHKELKHMSKEMVRSLMMDDEDDDNSKQTDPAVKINTEAPSNAKDGPSPEEKKKMTPPPSGGSDLLHRVMHDSSIMNVIKVLSKSMKIVLGACAPFIPEDFLEQVLKGMIYISKRMEQSFLDLGADLYMGIIKTLDHCSLKHNQEFKLNGSSCGDQSVVKGIYFPKSGEYWAHHLDEWSFRWGRWHPLLDAAWSIIDFIHSYCFESFMQDLMVMHVFQLSMEGLFPTKIQLLWRVNMVVNNNKFWNNLMQTFDLNVTMRNLDACQEGARRISPFPKTLPRPFLTLAEVSKQAPPPVEEISEEPKGWTNSLEKYWKHYEKLGGFPKVSEDFGKCFGEAHLEEEEDMIDNLKRKCSSNKN